jgi:DNA-binding NarL/FixJ family response regulator
VILADDAGPTVTDRDDMVANPESTVDDPLTERERRTAVLLAYGHTNRDVAQKLHVSVRTAEAERARLMRKLGFARRAELVRWALQRGLLR